jgi:hypothetical protein
MRYLSPFPLGLMLRLSKTLYRRGASVKRIISPGALMARQRAWPLAFAHGQATFA